MSKLERSNSMWSLMESELDSISDVEEFVKFINFYGLYFAQNPPSHLYSPKLELKIKAFQFNMPSIHENFVKNTLHVATSIYSTGGHTRVIENWIHYKNQEQHDVVITSQSVPVKMNLPEGTVVYQLDSKLSEVQKINKLSELYSQYEKIIFHIHPYDTTPLIAMGKFNKMKFFLFNHADHIFNIGHSLVGKTYDLSSVGSLYSLNFRGAEYSKIIPVPLNDTAISAKKDISSANNIFRILLIGTEYKFIPNDKFNLFQFANDFCKGHQNIEFTFVGPSPHLKEKYQISNENVKFMGRQDYKSLSRLYEQADLYIDSLPIGGGIAILEAALHRCPVITFENGLNLFDSIKPFAINYKELGQKILEFKNDSVMRKKSAESAHSLALNHIGDNWLGFFEKPDTTFEKISTGELKGYTQNLSEKYSFTLPNSPYWLNLQRLYKLYKTMRDWKIVLKIVAKQLLFKYFYNSIKSLDNKFKIRKFLS